LIWDPAKSEEHGVNDKTIADLSPGIKEAALLRLAELGYDENLFLANVKSIKPTDGSNWGQERRERFRDEMFRSRKDFRAVCRSMRIPMKTCLAYYYGTFKFSDDYRLLKCVCCEEDAMRMEANEHAFDACAVCGDGGNLLICDGCEGEYHMECCRPALRNVPEGHWLCDECVDRKFLAARQYVIKSSALFERHDRTLSPGAVRDEDGMFEDLPEGVETVLYKPSDSVLLAVRKFAKGLNQLLATGTVDMGDGKVEDVSESEPVADAEDATMVDASVVVEGDGDGVPAPSVDAAEGTSRRGW
jgi:PHD-finger